MAKWVLQSESVTEYPKQPFAAWGVVIHHIFRRYTNGAVDSQLVAWQGDVVVGRCSSFEGVCSQACKVTYA